VPYYSPTTGRKHLTVPLERADLGSHLGRDRDVDARQLVSQHAPGEPLALGVA
jgi:hypothetical protein